MIKIRIKCFTVVKKKRCNFPNHKIEQLRIYRHIYLEFIVIYILTNATLYWLITINILSQPYPWFLSTLIVIGRVAEHFLTLQSREVCKKTE